jgi:uncharacterized protein (TIGR03086 family)
VPRLPAPGHAEGVDLVDALERTYASLEQLLRSLSAEDLAARTPCPEWDVRGVLDHVIGNAHSFKDVAAGAQFAPAAGDPVGDDPAGSVRAAADEAVAAWRRGRDQPTGMIPDVTMLDINLADTVLHTWDIAKATGRDPALPGDVVDYVLSKMEGQWHQIGHQMGAFGPPCAAADDAPPVDRLAALTGRRP